MATTSPDNIRTPNPTDPYNLIADLAIIANDTQTAISKRGNMYTGTAAQRGAFSTAPEGTHWQDTDGQKYEWVRKNGAWRGARPLAGAVLVSQANGTTAGTLPISFPAGYFATTPGITVSAQTGAPQSVFASYGSPAPTGFTIYAFRPGGGNTDAMWIASPTS